MPGVPLSARGSFGAGCGDDEVWQDLAVPGAIGEAGLEPCCGGFPTVDGAIRVMIRTTWFAGSLHIAS